MIERRLVSTQLINLSFSKPDRRLVAYLTQMIQQLGGPQGTVLLYPRKSDMDRYRPATNVEVVHAAVLAGEVSVWALIGEWPSSMPDLLPLGSILETVAVTPSHQSSSEQSSPTDLNPLQRADYFAEQIRVHGSQEKAAYQLGIKRSVINNTVQLLKLRPEVQNALINRDISESVARTIALTDAKHQLRMLHWYETSNPKPTIRELEQAIRFIGDGAGDFRVGKVLSQQYADELSNHYGCEIRFRSTGRGGWCKILVSDLDSELIAQIVDSAQLHHKPKVTKKRWGVELTFKYRDANDLMALLPNR
jgi:hypothetical protein